MLTFPCCLQSTWKQPAMGFLQTVTTYREGPWFLICVKKAMNVIFRFSGKSNVKIVLRQTGLKNEI